MADGNLDESIHGENSARPVFGEQFYRERWEATVSDPPAIVKLAKAESLIIAALGLARLFTADVSAQDFNSECQGADIPTMTSWDREAVGIALVNLLNDASVQMAESRRD